ncbi:MAG: ABC transporter ATP-binding protein [Acidobacteria bacterium]|nr:ABC transporter ATP-binding protein [Acidobacteriota bacterium]
MKPQTMKIRENPSRDVPILELHSLCKDYVSGSCPGNSIRVVDNVDMKIETGEIRGIVGESGAGKTTLARCSLRLIEPSSGSAWFDGQDLAALNAAQLRARRKDFQMIFQDVYASLNPAMTVEQILLEPLQVHHVKDRNYGNGLIHEMLEAVSLSKSLISRRPAELSGGQQQRVGIARGLILKPRLVIADEPMSALDASVQAQMLNLLADLKKRYDLTLILISHSLPAIHYLCTHISVLYRGKLVEEAPGTVFFDRPRHPYSQALLDSAPLLDAKKPMRIRSMPAIDSFPLNTQTGCAFFDCCPYRLPICAREAPPLRYINSGEGIACFLYSQHS